MSVLGVGLIGAGAASQAIHIPSIAALGDLLRVVHVADTNTDIGEEVARRTGARFSADIDELLRDKSVDVVAVCSPDWLHADHVEAVCRAGKRAILCEKPLAQTMSDAHRIAEASRRYDVPVIVGAMQCFDPAFLAAKDAWGEPSSDPVQVRSMIWLPDNDEMTQLATHQFGATVTPGSVPQIHVDVAERASLLSASILGLAVHNLPLVRMFAPRVDRVTEAQWVDPYGYAITLEGPSGAVRMTALMPGLWEPQWTFEVTDRRRHLAIEFPPSYVLAGSATATLTGPEMARSWRSFESGYENEWRRIAALAAQASSVPDETMRAIEDLGFAIDIAGKAASLLLGDAA